MKDEEILDGFTVPCKFEYKSGIVRLQLLASTNMSTAIELSIDLGPIIIPPYMIKAGEPADLVKNVKKSVFVLLRRLAYEMEEENGTH